MSSNIMPEEVAIKIHLSPEVYTEGGMRIHSGFWGAMRNARESTGRHPETGRKLADKMHGSWLGAIGYMSLLDQIGKCFKPRNTTELESGYSIEKALSYFSYLNTPEYEQQRGALYALRCAFMHDYSLYNINRRSKYQHWFTVTEGLVQGLNTPVVQLPSVFWDGEFSSMEATNNITTVNLEAFGDMVEDVCENLFTLEQKHELQVILPGGSDELIRRYTFNVFTSNAHDTLDVLTSSAQTKVT